MRSDPGYFSRSSLSITYRLWQAHMQQWLSVCTDQGVKGRPKMHQEYSILQLTYLAETQSVAAVIHVEICLKSLLPI